MQRSDYHILYKKLDHYGLWKITFAEVTVSPHRKPFIF